DHLRRTGVRRCALFDRRKRLYSVERWRGRLRSVDENHEPGHEREPLKSSSRYHRCAHGNRFCRLLVARFERTASRRATLAMSVAQAILFTPRTEGPVPM